MTYLNQCHFVCSSAEAISIVSAVQAGPRVADRPASYHRRAEHRGESTAISPSRELLLQVVVLYFWKAKSSNFPNAFKFFLWSVRYYCLFYRNFRCVAMFFILSTHISRRNKSILSKQFSVTLPLTKAFRLRTGVPFSYNRKVKLHSHQAKGKFFLNVCRLFFDLFAFAPISLDVNRTSPCSVQPYTSMWWITSDRIIGSVAIKW